MSALRHLDELDEHSLTVLCEDATELVYRRERDRLYVLRTKVPDFS